jgi:GMP synthase-like glutamine amidotransferase
MRHVAVVQHTQSEWLGAIEDHLEGRGIRFSYFRPFTVGGRLPDVATLGDGLILLGGGPFGAAPGPWQLPALDAEVRLARACVMLARPVVGFGLGAQVLALAADGSVVAAPLSLTVREARRTSPEALGGLMPERLPQVVYMRDRPAAPGYARVLAVDADGAPAVFQIGDRAFGFTGNPGIRRAMVEDLIMEFDEAPADAAQALAQFDRLGAALEDALVPLMAGLVDATGWMQA